MTGLETNVPRLDASHAEFRGKKLGGFLLSCHNKALISPDNASRLVSQLTDLDNYDEELTKAIDRLGSHDNSIKERTPKHSNMIACALRETDDFELGNAVLYKDIHQNSRWVSDSRVLSIDESLVTISDGPSSISIKPNYPGLFTVEDFNTLYSSRPGTGFSSLAHFIVQLSFYDREMNQYPELIERVSQKFGASRY